MEFKNILLSDFSSMDHYLEYPKYGKETLFETDSFDEMFRYVLNEEGRSFTFYFENKLADKIKQGIIQINKDGSICLALSAENQHEDTCIQKLKEYSSDYPIYVSHNKPLPSSKEELHSKYLN